MGLVLRTDEIHAAGRRALPRPVGTTTIARPSGGTSCSWRCSSSSSSPSPSWSGPGG